MGFNPHKTQSALSEINVTPLVDVMLVLLIVFMISAPLMQQGVQVDLPKANAQTLTETPEQLLLIVNKSKQITLNGTPISEGNLRTKLLAVVQNKPDIQLFIQADQTVPYGFIAAVMAEVRQARISKVGLVTEQAEPGFKL